MSAVHGTWDAVRLILLQDIRDYSLLFHGECAIQQPEDGSPEQDDACPQDIDGDKHGKERVEQLPAGQATAPTPSSTPADVHTSVIKWCASASSVVERYWRPAANSTRAVPRLMNEASTEIARPMPTCSRARG